MEEVARSVHPTLVDEIKKASEECAYLGRTGANLYCCTNYTAAMHQENDAASGLCSQLLWSGIAEYAEWGFVLPQYSCYIKTRPNLLW